MPLAERDRRALIIFGVIVAVALLAYFLFLKPKGGGQPSAVGPSNQVTSPPPIAPTTSAPGTPRTTPSPVFTLGGKDPFSPLVASGGGVGPTGTGSFSTSPFPTGTFSTGPCSTSP